MAVILPVIAAIGTVSAAGGVVAAMSTVGGFLTVAGGALAGIGAITGNKKLQKFGSILSLGGGAAAALGYGATGAAASGTAGSGLQGTAGGVSEAAGTAVAGEGGLTASQMTDSVTGIGDSAAMKPVNYSLGSASPQAAEGGLMWQKSAALAANQAPAAVGQIGGAMPQSNYSMGTIASGSSKLADVASGMTSNDLSSILSRGWDRTQQALKGVGQFVKDNKELVQIGGSALAEMYGPQAEQFDYQKSLMEQAKRNINTPIRLAMNPVGR